jgi:MraZ protein
MFFYGQFYHTLDEKGRLTIPSRFRDQLAAEGVAFVMQGFDQNLMVFPAAAFALLTDQVNSTNLADANARKMRRLIFGTAYQLEVDKAGRILIPPHLRETASLQSDVVIVGGGPYFELWSPELWNGQREDLSDIDANDERFQPFQLMLK